MRAFLTAGVALLVSAPAWAGMVTMRLGTPVPARAAGAGRKAERPTAYVVEADKAPELDGKLDDAAWGAAAVLRLARTLDGSGPAAQATQARLCRRGEVLYVAVRAVEPRMARLRAPRRPHDGGVWNDDSVEIFIGRGGGDYWHYGVNAAGSTYDGKAKAKAWHAGAGFKAAAGRERGAWTLEIAIPLRPMAGAGALAGRWTLNINRNRQVSGQLQEASWSPTFTGSSHVPGRFGRMLLKAPPKAEQAADEKPDLTVVPTAEGVGVLRFDLSGLPEGARIRRADLRIFRGAKIDGGMDQALVDVEVYPLFKAPAEGARVAPTGRPLAIRPPWFDRLDATEAVRAWAKGKTNGGFYVKACPLINAAATCLDVACEGGPTKVPPPVTEVKAVHRAGQTFITWKEITDPVGKDEVTWGEMKRILAGVDTPRRVRYCVYRWTRPITAKTLAEAELIAEVAPLSGWNVNGRNLARPIDRVIATATHVEAPRYGSVFDSARMDGKYGVDCPIDRFVVPGGEAGRPRPLARGAGLYVHTPGKAGKAFYAVVTSVDGVQSTAQVPAVGPVAETDGAGEPVLQGELPPGPLWRYKQKRLHYVRWVAPPLCNLPSRYFNWSVALPAEMPEAAPLELNLHWDRGSYWRTQYRLERDSIVISPHDFPFPTWWYGYHESRDTLRSYRRGAVHNYTQRRLLAFIEWASKRWPVDRGRVLATGIRYRGGFGALRLGVACPDVFALVVTGHGLPDARYGVEEVNKARWSRGAFDSLIAAVGRIDWGLKTPDGEDVWDALDVNRRIAALPPSAELPLIAMTSRNDWTPCREFYRLMLAQRRAVVGSYMWGGTTMIPVTATGTFPNALRQLVRSDAPVLAFKSATIDEQLAGGKQGTFNDRYRWRPETVVDKTDRFEVVAFYREQYGRGETKTTDVALRRRAKFKPRPGVTVKWTVTPVGGKAAAQSGELRVSPDGLVVVPGVQLTEAGVRIKLAAQ